MVWTHEDSGGQPILVAVDEDGEVVTSVRVAGARNVDWEALERSDCPSGSCLWVGDVGNNRERRTDATLYRLREPPLPDTEASRATGASEAGASATSPADTVAAEAFPIRLPEGPRDVEALFVLPGQRIHLVTKGRSDPVTVYRYPGPLRPSRTVTLEEVQRLSEAPPPLARQVTGAAASPDGRAVAVRTYRSLTFYRVRRTAGEDGAGPPDRLLQPVSGGEVDLRPLRETQGEAVAWAEDRRLVLTSESGAGGRGALRFLDCPVPELAGR